MTQMRDLKDMLAICEARYAKRQQDFAKLVSEENRLRTELAKLAQMTEEASAADAGGIQMRSIGADVIWQGWLGRTKVALNMQLAKVLAVKEQHLKEVREAFGKVLAVKKLLQNLHKERQGQAAAKVLAVAIDMSVGKKF